MTVKRTVRPPKYPRCWPGSRYGTLTTPRAKGKRPSSKTAVSAVLDHGFSSPQGQAPTGMPPGVALWRNEDGSLNLLEQRNDRVWVVLSCPVAEAVPTMMQLWAGSGVGRPDLSLLVDPNPGPLPPLAPLEPPLPWFRRTPGLVALFLWLVLLLPLISLGLTRRKKKQQNPLVVYGYGVALTVLAILALWLLGY